MKYQNGYEPVRRQLEPGQSAPGQDLLRAFQASIEAAYAATAFGHYELARTELERAKIILTDMEKHANATIERESE